MKKIFAPTPTLQEGVGHGALPIDDQSSQPELQLRPTTYTFTPIQHFHTTSHKYTYIYSTYVQGVL